MERIHIVVEYEGVFERGTSCCKALREAVHSFADIARQVGCNKSAANYIYQWFEKLVRQRKKLGQVGLKNSEREERVIYRASRHLRFSTLSDLKTKLVDNISRLESLKRLVKRILWKYGMRSCL